MGQGLTFNQSRPPAGRPPLLLIFGSDAEARTIAEGGLRLGGNSDVFRLLPEGLRFDQLNLSKQFRDRPDRPRPANYPLVLNLVTDPDQHPRTLETLAKLLRGHRGRIFNHPEAVLKTGRDQVAKRLAGIDGLRVPKVLRLRNPAPGAARKAAENAGLAFPAIVRLAGTHTGKVIGLVDDAEQLESACRGPGDHFVIEFVDFASADGLYRKYRFWSFGNRTVFKHVIISDKWNVHNKDRERTMADRPDLIAEEKQLLSRPEGDFPEQVHRIFNEVRKRLALDFFGMDFSLASDGRMILFEANATMSYVMTFSPPFHYLTQANEPAREAFREMLRG